MTSRVIRVFLRKMSISSQSLFVPGNVRGMTVLDREQFLRNIKIPVLNVKEEYISNIVFVCRNFFLKLENFKPVQDVSEGIYKKCLHLNPLLVSRWEDFDEKTLNDFKLCQVSEENFSIKELQFGYDNWTYDTIFKAVLPENEEVVSSYTQIGHIIHLNLREHVIDYRFLIGQVLVDKIKKCRTVVYKTNTIDNTYRNFQMELIAGDEDFIVLVKENGTNFQFDFSKVYWNTRLGKEHERIITEVKSGDLLFDVFAGVGPFSLPLAKRRRRVFANDLNPECYKWINHNAKINKISPKLFQSYNLDGKDFILQVLGNYLIDICNGIEKFHGSKIHVTMNLPAIAVEFLKYFKGLVKDKTLAENYKLNITVYLYCFTFGSDEEAVESAKKLVSEHMGFDMSSHILNVFNVRKVAPTKHMMRVTINITKDIIFDSDNNSVEEPPVKKQCVEG